MTELLLPFSGHPAAQTQPGPTAAQQALRERRAVPLNALQHGDYYNGLLDNMVTTARWHAQRRRFVFWVPDVGQPKLKAAPHVADLGSGARFAPLTRQASDGGSHISDFAFETTR